MTDPALREAVEELCAAYAECIDEDRLEEWPDFFVDDCRYRITNRADHLEGLPHGVVYAASKGMLTDRVTALRRANIYERHLYRHMLGRVLIERVEGGVAIARSNFLVVRIMHDGATDLFASGRYLDRIEVSRRPSRFIERLVVCDSPKLDTLLAIPL
ncbi:MAG TPA: aromatic-ring-hydroxylating dioxygenase subunit beta [Stellaceae bacterium]|nr:aromatic-ring-hydroxylating dioxygenase subunit beta [Stellaceae bacterium]